MDFYDAADRVFFMDEGDGDGRPYLRAEGWTIGRGHFIGERIEMLKLSPEAIQAQFRCDLAVAIRTARSAIGAEFFDNMAQARQMALVTLAFTMGEVRLKKFEPSIELMRQGDWQAVADRVQTWKWASDVDPKRIPDKGRDDRIAYMFRTGTYPEYYGLKV